MLRHGQLLSVLYQPSVSSLLRAARHSYLLEAISELLVSYYINQAGLFSFSTQCPSHFKSPYYVQLAYLSISELFITCSQPL
jgi:hypothetical protein